MRTDVRIGVSPGLQVSLCFCEDLSKCAWIGDVPVFESDACKGYRTGRMKEIKIKSAFVHPLATNAYPSHSLCHSTFHANVGTT